MKVSPRPGLVFVIGMKRSGTSWMRRLVEHSTRGAKLLFEPHDIWWCIQFCNLERMRSTAEWKAIRKRAEETFEAHTLAGAKFAYDPGQVGFYGFQKLEHAFVSPKYVFVQRKWEDTWASYQKLMKNLPLGMESLHRKTWEILGESYVKFVDEHPDRSCLVQFEDLLVQKDAAFAPVLGILGVSGTKPDMVAKMVKQPRFTTDVRVVPEVRPGRKWKRNGEQGISTISVKVRK